MRVICREQMIYFDPVSPLLQGGGLGVVHRVSMSSQFMNLYTHLCMSFAFYQYNFSVSHQ
jgi:hypothetical protein